MTEMCDNRDERDERTEDRDEGASPRSVFGGVHNKFQWDESDLPGLVWLDDDDEEEDESEHA